MVNVLISGALGKMGQAVASEIKIKENIEVAAGFDRKISNELNYPVYDNFENIKEQIDIIIDFSNPLALDSILDYGLKNNVPLVLCTTGYSNNDKIKIKKAAKSIPIFYSQNMSIGVNLITELVKKTALILSDEFDIEIIEKHHNQKLDAPSGTALMLADAVSSVRDNTKYIYDRHCVRKKRDKNDIGIHSIRCGNIVGEHEVIFADDDEIIEISHKAMSKKIFAKGAVNAAGFLLNKPAGIYNMSDMLKQHNCI